MSDTKVKTYIQQTFFDGLNYHKGTCVDILDRFNIVCSDFPFKKNPKAKEIAKINYPDRDGSTAFIPQGALPVDEYEIDVKCLYKGTMNTIRQDVSDFIDFLYGRIKGNNSDTVQSSRLSIYNEYVAMGRRDVIIREVDDDIYFKTSDDPDSVAEFSVKFLVMDPVTNIIPVVSDGVVIDLALDI